MAVPARATATPGAQLVDPHVLARVGNLDLLARSVVDGFINGLHRSPYYGSSVDFAEHRGYVPGDDVRRIDWRVFGRTDRFYVKEYEADSNANVAMLVDVSRSMGFGSHGVTKLQYGKFLAACLTYLARQQRDRVGLVTFDREIVDYVPCSAKHFELVLHGLDRAEAREPGALERPLTRMAEHFGRRGILALISDLYEDPDVILKALAPLRVRGHDVVVFHLLDPAELTFPYSDATTFEDLESGEQLPIVPQALGDRYRELVNQHVAAIRSKCSELRIDYALFDTSTPLDRALVSYLTARTRMDKPGSRG